MKRKFYVFIALVVLVCSLSMVASAADQVCPRCYTSQNETIIIPDYARYSATQHTDMTETRVICKTCGNTLSNTFARKKEPHTWVANGDIHNYGVNQTHTFYTLCKWCNEPSTLITSCTNPCNGGGGGILSIEEPHLHN